jgi:hypothetical protein
MANVKIQFEVDVNHWWNSKHDLQKKNLANNLFNQLHDWVDIEEFKITENDKILMYLSELLFIEAQFELDKF